MLDPAWKFIHSKMSYLDARIALQQSRFNLIQKAADGDDVENSGSSRQLLNTRLDMLEKNWVEFQKEHEDL